MPPSSPDGPALKGIKVLAFEVSVAAPHCTRILGDMGADVIKIEKPVDGDLIRHWDTAVQGLSSGYVWLNYNKRSLAIDVKKGIGVLKRIAKTCDIFVENFAPGVATRLGLGYEDLSRENPRLIYCSVSGYGQSGPYRDVKAYDLLIQGEAGIIATTGYPGKPAKVAIPIVDLASSMYATVGIMTALYQREKTGKGQYIDIAMFESVVSWQGYFLQHYWHQHEEPELVGFRHHYVTPYGPFLARDDVYVSFAVATKQDWEVFCREVILRPDFLEDERYQTSALRRKNRKVMEEAIEQIFLQHDHEEWLERLKKAKLPYGEVRGIGQVAQHPQAEARGMFPEIDSELGRIHVTSSPLRLSDSPAQYGPLASLGDGNESILREFGYTDAEIQKMRDDKVI
jgi:crotonobetainyl-CoA:carnitine CoA-transferase CaiB-like acyl-CoA transferase